ncbi:MAG TPA: hypothetical protein VHR55_10250 [Candidatus Limnocylindria bacterium]|nr:hypothetical protein [Candidatus Limnocylindria bacterium]
MGTHDDRPIVGRLVEADAARVELIGLVALVAAVLLFVGANLLAIGFMLGSGS